MPRSSISIRLSCLIRILAVILKVAVASSTVNNFLQESSSLRGTVDNDVRGNQRSLQSQADIDKAIEFLPFGDGAVAVRIKQTFIGQCSNGVPDNKIAKIFFATYLNPDTGEESCHFQRDADPCYSRTLVIGCDPNTNFAVIRVYALSLEFGAEEQVPNPKVGGRCFPQENEMIKKARMVRATIDCKTEKFQSCASDDECTGKTYCSNPVEYYGVTSRYCIPYSEVGGICNAPFAPTALESNECNPEIAFCRQDVFACKGSFDFGGTCVAYGPVCTTSDDCDAMTEYCDLTEQKCKPRLLGESCCTFDEECPVDFSCTEKATSDFGPEGPGGFGGNEFVCTPP